MCPWCYIGKRRLEKAIEQLQDEYEFDISYVPFELNPDMPKAGADQKKYLVKKFGSEDKYHQITQHVAQVAAGEGLSFDFENQQVAPNTLKAHRIILLAKDEGKQLQVKEAFLKAYFEDAVDLSKDENLLAIATKAGLTEETVRQWLEGDQGEAEVKLAEQINYQRGVSGVPFYIINNKYGVSGAQPAETFVKIFSEVGKESIPAGATTEQSKEIKTA